MSVAAAREFGQAQQATRPRGYGDLLPGLWLFVVGASIAVDVPIMGRLLGPDILCSVGLIALMLGRNSEAFGKETRLFFLMVGLWFFGLVITDLIRGTAVDDLARGWSKIVFFTIAFAYLYLATRGRLSRIIWFFLGLNAGELATLLIAPDDFFDAEPWKFGYGPPVTAFLMFCISTPFFARIAGWWGQAAATMLLAVTNLAGNSRAVFGLLFTVAAITVLAPLLNRLMRGRPLPKALFAVTMVSSIFFYQGVAAIYETAASSGILGREAREKYEMQTEGGAGLLLGGRAESLVSTQAIADSPIIGHGSWAKDYSYIALYVEALEKRGVPIIGDPYGGGGLIPSHSFLLGAWVEGGILGGLFWIYILTLCVRSLYSLFHIPSGPRPLVTLVILTLMWDVLFSPFGAQQRVIVPAELCFVLWAIRNERTNFRNPYGRAE